MNRTFSRFHWLVGCFVFCGAMILESPGAFAVVIDDFTQGGLSQLQATNYSGVTVLQTGLDPLHAVGGTRSVHVRSASGVGSLGLASASVDPVNGRFHFTANSGLGYFKLGWGTVSPMNLNLSGQNAFQLDFVDVTPALTSGILDLRVRSANTWFRYSIWNDLAQALGGNSHGTLTVPFTRFAGADFSRLQTIELDAARVSAGIHLSIDSFTAVPEPSVAFLLLLAPGLMRFARPARK